MLVKEKLNLDKEGLVKYGAINIVVFGDSVTHGALNNEYDYETVYWNVLKRKLNNVRSYVPVNVINSGIEGITAKESVKRIERDILCHNPDMIIICFGLNDVNGTLYDYLSSLKIIFEKCKEKCEQVVFLTPNMLNTYVSDNVSEELSEYAKITADYQNGGKMDSFISNACHLAYKCKIDVCDAYSYWKNLAETGTDTTDLLCNYINHPTREMHQVFADMLFDLIMN